MKQYLPRRSRLHIDAKSCLDKWILTYILWVKASNFTLQLNFKKPLSSRFGIVPAMNVKCPPPYNRQACVFEHLVPSQRCHFRKFLPKEAGTLRFTVQRGM